MSTTKTRMVACPNCGAPSAFSPQNKFRPFCSERCKMIDLGAWASEDYKIADNKPTNDLDSENLD